MPCATSPRSTEAGIRARRIVNAHAVTMSTVTGLVAAGIAVRVLAFWHEPSTTGQALALTRAAAVFTVIGGSIGGSISYDYGFNVETAGDSPVWHPSGSACSPATEPRPPLPFPAVLPA